MSEKMRGGSENQDKIRKEAEQEGVTRAAFQLLESGDYEVVDKKHLGGYTGMGSGISPTKDLIIDRSKGIVVGFGVPWASGEPKRSEEPVWFYGLKEDLPDDVRPLESRFSSFEKVNERFEAVLPEMLESERRLEAMKDDPSKRKIFTEEGIVKRTEQQIIDDANKRAAWWVTGMGDLAARFLELKKSRENSGTKSE